MTYVCLNQIDEGVVVNVRESAEGTFFSVKLLPLQGKLGLTIATAETPMGAIVIT